MRSIETILRSNPKLTGEEILALQARDKEEDDRLYQKRHKKDLELIKDINTNGGYFKGTFGDSQKYVYRIFDVEMDDTNNIICKVEKLVLFERENDFSVEVRIKDYAQFDTIYYSWLERITKDDFDEVKNYLRNMSTKFW